MGKTVVKRDYSMYQFSTSTDIFAINRWRWRRQPPPTTDHQAPTTDHRPPNTDHWIPTTNHRPPGTDPRPLTTDHQKLTTDHWPPTTNHHHQPPTTDHHHHRWIGNAPCHSASELFITLVYPPSLDGRVLSSSQLVNELDSRWRHNGMAGWRLRRIAKKPADQLSSKLWALEWNFQQNRLDAGCKAFTGIIKTDCMGLSPGAGTALVRTTPFAFLSNCMQ